MVPYYVPIVKAKTAEFNALSKMSNEDANHVHAFFEVSRITPNITNSKRFEGCQTLSKSYLDEVMAGVVKAWHGRVAMIDAYQWQPNATVETGEHILPYIYNTLDSLGIKVIPVLGYDRWHIPEYQLAIQNLELLNTPYYCIRIDPQSIQDIDDPVFFEDNINDILTDMKIPASSCSVLIDFGDATTTSIQDMIEKSEAAFSILQPYGFKYFATSACSLPNSIEKAVKDNDSVGKVLRKEMLLWQTLRSENLDLPLVYSDYGIRSPSSNEGTIAPHANGKIRYTIDKHFYIARGHSMQLAGKGQQMWDLAKKVISSPHYMGEDFSWGDKRIMECSQKMITGGHPQWITIDTSHHLAYVVMEVEDFEISLTAGIAAADEV